MTGIYFFITRANALLTNPLPFDNEPGPCVQGSPEVVGHQVTVADTVYEAPRMRSSGEARARAGRFEELDQTADLRWILRKLMRVMVLSFSGATRRGSFK